VGKYSSAFFGGVVGGFVAGPIGVGVGAFIGSLFGEEAENISVNCPNCNNSLTISKYGYWSCPHCKKSFIFLSNMEKPVDGTKFWDTGFKRSVFSMFAKLAKADGLITKDEINSIQNFMDSKLDYSPQDKKEAIEYFNLALKSETSFIEYAKEFKAVGDALKIDDEIYQFVGEMFVIVAFSDGKFDEEESALIKTALKVFGIPQYYESLVNKYRNTGNDGNSNISTIDKAFAILECTQKDSNDTIKKKYRSLIIEYHPDKIMSKGLPEGFIEFANKKVAEINEAYEIIKKNRKFS